MEHHEYTLQPRPFKNRQVKRTKGKGKGKGGSTGTGRAFLGEEQAQDPEWRSEEGCAWWSKGKRGKKGFSKGNENFWKGGFRTNPSEKGASNDVNPHKGRGKDQKGKGTESAYPQSGLSLGNTQRRSMPIPGIRMTGLPASGLTIPQLQLLGGLARELIPFIRRTLFLILVAHCQLDQELQSEGSRNMRCVMALQQKVALAISRLCLPSLRQKRVGKVVLYTFRQYLHVLPELMCLRQVMCPSCFPSSEEKFGDDYWIGSTRRQDYMSSVGLVLFSGRMFHSGTYCVGFDEPCVPAKVAWAICSPEEACNFCSIEAKISISSSCTRIGRRRRW